MATASAQSVAHIAERTFVSSLRLPGCARGVGYAQTNQTRQAAQRGRDCAAELIVVEGAVGK